MDQHVSQQWEQEVLIENPCDCNWTVSRFCEFPYSLTRGPVSRPGNACPFRVPFNWLAHPSNFCEHWVLGHLSSGTGMLSWPGGSFLHYWLASNGMEASTLVPCFGWNCSRAAGGCRLKALSTWAVSLSSSISPLLLLSHFLRTPLHKSVWVRPSQFCS